MKLVKIIVVKIGLWPEKKTSVQSIRSTHLSRSCLDRWHWNLWQGCTVPYKYFTVHTRVSLTLYYLYGWDINVHWQCHARHCIASLLSFVMCFPARSQSLNLRPLAIRDWNLPATTSHWQCYVLWKYINNYHWIIRDRLIQFYILYD
jgi:hypothetical protein